MEGGWLGALLQGKNKIVTLHIVFRSVVLL